MTTGMSTRSGDLDPIARDDGTFAIVAMDQRNTLRRMFAAVDRQPEPDDLVRFKADVAQALMPVASGFLLDPDFGVPAARNLPERSGCGLLVAAEPADRGNHNGEPRTSRDPAQNAAWVDSLGGDAVKFLVQMRPGRPREPGAPDLVAEVLEIVEAVVADCRAAGVPSVIENLIYRLPDEAELTQSQRSDLIIESAGLLDALQPDLLKLEYPGSPAACRRLAKTISSPWAVLSAGVPFAQFREVLQISCDDGGASGFIAGRAIWKDAVGMDAEPCRRFLSGEGRARLESCVEAIDGRARPWRS